MQTKFSGVKSTKSFIKACKDLITNIDEKKLESYLGQNNELSSVTTIRATATQMVNEFNAFTKAYSCGRSVERKSDDGFTFNGDKQVANPCKFPTDNEQFKPITEKLQNLVTKAVQDYETTIRRALLEANDKKNILIYPSSWQEILN